MKNFKLDINDEFLIKELVEKLALSEEDAKSYINFISVNSTVKTPGKTEAHHVLPKSIFPEYLKSTWNLVNLSHFNHFKAHFLLAKGKNGKMLNALNRMMSGKTYKNLSLAEVDLIAAEYSFIKQDVSDTISKRLQQYYSNPQNRNAARERALKYFSVAKNRKDNKERLNNFKTKQKISMASREWFNNEENKIKHQRAVRAALSKPEYKIAISNSVAASWKNPEIRKAHIASRRKGYHWDNKDKLYELWISYNRPKHVMFRKMLVKNGYPIEASLQALVKEFSSL